MLLATLRNQKENNKKNKVKKNGPFKNQTAIVKNPAGQNKEKKPNWKQRIN